MRGTVLVAGAGVFGACIALALDEAGFAVTLADPAPVGDNASGVAAGMIAPATEAVFDGDAEHIDLLRRGRDRWPAFAEAMGVVIERPGVASVSTSEAQIDRWLSQLSAIGAPATKLPIDAARERSPELARGLWGVAVDEDWRIDCRPALRAMFAETARRGVVHRAAEVSDFATGQGRLSDGSTIAADALVIATGASRLLERVAGDAFPITPIKGHILELPGPPQSGPILRFDGGYVCPTRHGWIIGATMEAGRSDAAVDPVQVERLRDAARPFAPTLADRPGTARTGVRAATPDGLPIVGRAPAPGVWLALGARRNGWLLGPLVAESLVREMMGGAGERAFSPGRFNP